MVTIKDIAGRLGISHSTVGRALADHPHISAETKEKVRKTADELGYIAHAGAQIMRGGRSKLIGLIFPDVVNDFYATMASAMAECCQADGFQLVLSVTEDNPDVELKHLRALVSARAAGVVIVPSPAPHKDLVPLLRDLPFVQLIRHLPNVDSDSCGIDDVNAIQDAATHLIKLGHRDIAYIGPSEDLSTGADRLRGFKLAFRNQGLEAHEPVIELGPPRSSFGYDALNTVLRRGSPTAVLVGGARITEGVLTALVEHRISVPGDMSVIGFNDPPWARWWGSGLTTIALPVREVALQSGALLIRRIQERQKGEQPTGLFTNTHRASLMIRQSTGAPRMSAGREELPPAKLSDQPAAV